MSGFHKKPTTLTPVEPDLKTPPKMNPKLKDMLDFGEPIEPKKTGDDQVGDRLKRLLKTIKEINSRIDRLMGQY